MLKLNTLGQETMKHLVVVANNLDELIRALPEATVFKLSMTVHRLP